MASAGLALALTLFSSWPAARAAEDPGAPPTIPQLIEQGRRALLDDRYEDSQALLEQVLESPDFGAADPELQFYTLILAAYARSGGGDLLTAHEYLSVATGLPGADQAAWIHRARLAQALDKWEDAAMSLTTVARRWPDALSKGADHGPLVMRVVHQLGRRPTLQTQRRELLDALFAANFKLAFGIDPGPLWLLLAADAIERKDLERASAVVRRIQDSATLVALRIDKRFDALTTQNPKAFDVRAAAEREVRRLREQLDAHPRSLDVAVQYCYALYAIGRFREMIALADAIIQRVDQAVPGQAPYEDLAESLNWIYNQKSLALRELGRGEEAAKVLEDWRRSGRNSEDQVSQAINLGSLYNALGRPAEALIAIEGLDWARAMNDYGRMQTQYVRFQAFLQSGKTAEAQEVLNWMRQHQADSPDTVQSALLETGDIDGAAALLIARLRAAEQRSDVLGEIQTYARGPRTVRQRQLDANWQVLLSRPDVVAVIAEYGRREKFSIYSLRY